MNIFYTDQSVHIGTNWTTYKRTAIYTCDNLISTVEIGRPGLSFTALIKIVSNSWQVFEQRFDMPAVLHSANQKTDKFLKMELRDDIGILFAR